MSINNATHQRETLSERPIRLPLREMQRTLAQDIPLQNSANWYNFGLHSQSGSYNNFSTTQILEHRYEYGP